MAETAELYWLCHWRGRVHPRLAHQLGHCLLVGGVGGAPEVAHLTQAAAGLGRCGPGLHHRGGWRSQEGVVLAFHYKPELICFICITKIFNPLFYSNLFYSDQVPKVFLEVVEVLVAVSTDLSWKPIYEFVIVKRILGKKLGL